MTEIDGNPPMTDPTQNTDNAYSIRSYTSGLQTGQGPVSKKIEPIWRNSSEKIVESARNCEQRPQLDVNGLYDTSRACEAMPTFVNHQCAIIEYWLDFFW